MKISTIFLYDEPAIPEINISRLVEFLKQTFFVKVELRKNIFSFANNSTAKEIASCKIFNSRKPFEKHEPSSDEIIFEEANVKDSSNTKNIVLYDGYELQKIITKLIPSNELSLDLFHVIFTNKLTCTYDQNDFRYHGRALIGSNPSIISTTGIIEAPAKPREYYFDLISKFAEGLNINSVKRKYQGTYLEIHDERLSTITEGYLLQALFYYITGEPFCESRDCRLFNAHWQNDLIHSQLQVGKLCNKHQQILNNFGE